MPLLPCVGILSKIGLLLPNDKSITIKWGKGCIKADLDSIDAVTTRVLKEKMGMVVQHLGFSIGHPGLITRLWPLLPENFGEIV